MQLVEYTKSIHNRPEDFSLFSPKFLINPTMALQVFCRALRQRKFFQFLLKVKSTKCALNEVNV